MKKIFFLLILLLNINFLFSQPANSSKSYFPPVGKWEKRLPEQSGFDTAKLNEAIQFIIGNESKGSRSMQVNQANTFGKEPFGDGIGPFEDRGDPTGLIIHHGYIVATWGDPSKVEMTHSVTKSFLSTVIGLTYDKGLIKNVNDRVVDYVSDIQQYDSVSSASPKFISLFNTDHNKEITWQSMLQQNSDWEGTLWGKPDWADRPDKDTTQWLNRKRNKPGSVFEYNDVRVNALALATAYIWKKSLPSVLKEKIMDPIGASGSWKWEGYKNSWVLINNTPVQSVSGGGHWGGGMFINAYDMARFGLLTLHKGNWNEKQLISEKWIAQSSAPSTANPGYGYMNYFLNTDKKFYPAAPASAYMHVGNGTNIIYVDAEHDIVMVVRWIENNAVKEMVAKVLSSLK